MCCVSVLSYLFILALGSSVSSLYWKMMCSVVIGYNVPHITRINTVNLVEIICSPDFRSACCTGS